MSTQERQVRTKGTWNNLLASICLNHVPTCLNRNREHQRDLHVSLPLGIYQIYIPAGIFDVWLKQDINRIHIPVCI